MARSAIKTIDVYEVGFLAAMTAIAPSVLR